MAVSSPPLTRRIVTANDDEGQSYIAHDGPTPAILTVPERPGFRNQNIWRTIEAPAQVSAPDTVTEHKGVLPPANGTVLRVIDFPPVPADLEERRRQASATLKGIFGDSTHSTAHPVAGMHITNTVDYAIILSGSITAILDKDETDMHAGDILVQRATNHAWENRTDEIARVAFILIDGC